MKIKVLGLCVALAASVPVLAGTAGADPSNAHSATLVPLVCDDGQIYDAVANSGNSSVQTFSPAHDLNSSSVLIPVSFGEFSGTLTNSNGDIIDEFTEPGATKGRARATGNTPVHCTFTFGETFVVTEPGGDLPPGTYTFSGTGSVTGFIPGH